MLVATTNFVASLDDAVLRSGRFGRFIPVPPPDQQEAVEIIWYYVQKLVPPADSQHDFSFRGPSRNDVELIVADVFAMKTKKTDFFCGADLEEAVNRAFLLAVRAAKVTS